MNELDMLMAVCGQPTAAQTAQEALGILLKACAIAGPDENSELLAAAMLLADAINNFNDF
jgi:hypothetical protein